jgi:YVTN family beta-propeller protein
MRTKLVAICTIIAAAGLAQMANVSPAFATTSTRSSSIAITGNGNRLFSVNFVANSVTVFAVTGNGGELVKLDEVAVGREPICVAVADGQKAWVTNSASGTVSVIKRVSTGYRVIKEIPVGDEPRGCVLNEKGTRLLVANHTDGSVSIIDTKTDRVIGTVPVGGNPAALAIDGDRVFVTLFYARLIPGGPGESFDQGKEGVVKT